MIAEGEFDAVTADVFGAQHRQIVGYRSRIEDAQTGNFADAIRTQTLGTQILYSVDAQVAVIPGNGDLVWTCLFYFKRAGHQ